MLNETQLPNLDAWLRSILWDSKLPTQNINVLADHPGVENFEIHRLKARLPLLNGDVKIVQGVRDVFEIVNAPTTVVSTSADTSTPRGKIVLIGRHLNDKAFEQSFMNAIELP